jgi:hypothetical protein
MVADLLGSVRSIDGILFHSSSLTQILNNGFQQRYDRLMIQSPDSTWKYTNNILDYFRQTIE